MSYGCYLELINRAFNKIEITVEPTDKKEWGKPAMNKTTYNLSDNDYYRLDEYEMTPKGIHVLTAHGHFRVTISIDGKRNSYNKTSTLKTDAIPVLFIGLSFTRHHLPAWIMPCLYHAGNICNCRRMPRKRVASSMIKDVTNLNSSASPPVGLV